MTANNPTVRLTVPRPHAKQRLIYDCQSRFIVARCGRRFGKSKFIPVKRLKTMLNGGPVGYFAPTYKMLGQFWRETKSMLAPVTKHVSTQDHRLEFIGGGSYSMWSLDSPDSVRGQKYAAIDVDEAAMIPELEEAWNAVLRPTIMDFSGDAGFWSTPKGLNYFHTLASRGSDDAYPEWSEFHFTSYDNPYIQDSEIDDLKADTPEDIVKQEIYAEFIQGEGAVFRNITANLTKEPTTPDKHNGHSLVAGVDWGQVNDWTVISIACENCKREVELDRFNKIDWEFQRAKLNNLIEKWNVGFVLCEENSIGSPNLEALQKASNRMIRGFMTTAQSKPPLIQSLALCLEQEEMKWLDIPIATRELEAYEAKRNEITNRIQYNAPKGFHDDTVIARCLVREGMEMRKRNEWRVADFRF
jgi:hypothetical protein